MYQFAYVLVEFDLEPLPMSGSGPAGINRRQCRYICHGRNRQMSEGNSMLNIRPETTLLSVLQEQN